MNIVCVIVLSGFMKAFALQIQKYKGGYFNRDSISTALTKPTWYEINCGHVCAGIEECSSFLAPPSHEYCHAVPNPGRLVKTSPMSPNAAKLYYKESFQTVPHFLIIHNNGILEDYSLNNGDSPKITTYGKFPGNFLQPCVLFLEREMKLILRSRRNKDIYEWYFDNRNPVKVEYEGEDVENDRSLALCITSSKSGKLITYGGNGGTYSLFLHQGGRARVIGIDLPRRAGCAAFHPENDDILFVFGGREGTERKDSFSYQFSTDEYQTLRELDGGKRDFHRCMGFINKNGKPAIIIVGGRVNTNPTDTVLEYNIDSNSFKEAPPMPYKRYGHALTMKDGFFYGFGGKDEKNDPKIGIFRVPTSLEANWEHIGQMAHEDFAFDVVSYN